MIKAQTMKQVRRFHHYLGVFFTPAILLFAFSGALQTFRLQEEKGYGGTPPSWIVWMASVHKDSSLPRAKSVEPEQRPASRPSEPSTRDVKPAVPRPSRLPMKIFVTLLSIGLIVSSLLGTIIALTNKTTRRASALMLFAGTALPLLLMLL